MPTALLTILLWLTPQVVPPAAAPSTGKTSARGSTFVRRREVDANAQKAASKSLATLRAVINESNYRLFGLDSTAGTNDLELGNPLPVYFVSSKALASYTPGSDAGKLMTKTDRLLYPVTLHGKGVTVMTIEKTNGRWALLDFNGSGIAPTVAQASSQTRVPSAARRSNRPGTYFAVEIPSLKSLTFIAYAPAPGPGGNGERKRNVLLEPTTTSGQFHEMFAAAADKVLASHPNFSSDKNGVASANDVFKSLIPEAAKVANANVPQ